MAQLAVNPGQAWGIWRTISEVSPRVIVEEADRSVTLAVVGDEASCAWLKNELLGQGANDDEKAAIEAHFKPMETPPDFAASGFYPFVLYVCGPDRPIGVRGEKSAPFSGTLDEVLRWMLEHRPDRAIAFARAFPRLRRPACEQLIARAARANAQIAFFSALPKLIPFPLPFLPISSLADVILLTKNQAMLIMRLAAARGQRPGYNRQVKELLGTVAAALGWRTLARGLVEFVPLGVGAALKAAIAYSGTVAVGRATLFYYERGVAPSAEQIRQFEKDAKADADAEAARLVQRGKPDPSLGEGEFKGPTSDSSEASEC